MDPLLGLNMFVCARRPQGGLTTPTQCRSSDLIHRIEDVPHDVKSVEETILSSAPGTLSRQALM